MGRDTANDTTERHLKLTLYLVHASEEFSNMHTHGQNACTRCRLPSPFLPTHHSGSSSADIHHKLVRSSIARGRRSQLLAELQTQRRIEPSDHSLAVDPWRLGRAAGRDLAREVEGSDRC